MIFYFSGTANSLYVAKKISEADSDRLLSIASAVRDGNYEFKLSENEAVGFIYPVYAWAPPQMVLEFIKKLKLVHYKQNFIYSVASCGANIGNTMKVLENSLREKGMMLNSGFSLIMPNNYNIMGDVDSKETEARKLAETDKRLGSICAVVKERRNGVFELEKGIWTFLGTSIINPMFMKHAMKADKFYAEESCNSCGICAKVCNCRNIIVDKKPIWGNECSQCLACLNYCPKRAIQYGSKTVNKGRYTNPHVSVGEMMLK